MSEVQKSNALTVCKNCQTEFKGKYCPECGQSIWDYEKPFGLLIYDLMGNIFAFDTRLWRTFKAVLFQPGKLEDDFIKGHRVKYMPPFRFYVFVSFIFFLMLNYSSSENKGIVKLKENSKSSFQLGMGEVELGGKSKADLLRFDLNVDEEESVTEREQKLAEILSHPEYYIPEFIKYISWMLFLLMPLYGSLLWLLFHKKHRFYLGHLIFAINQHSFLFILLIVLMATSSIFPESVYSIVRWVILLAPVYTVIGARRLYQRKYLTIISRFILIGSLYLILLVFGVAISALLTFS